MNESRIEAFGKHILAGLILLIAGWILLKFLVHIALAVFGVVVIILAIVAFIWALRVLF